MSHRILVVVVAAVLSAVPSYARAQAASATTEAATCELRLRDGSRVYGRVVSESPTEVTFETTSGVVLTSTRDRILSLKPVAGHVRNGEFHLADPNDTRLFFGPTGRSLPKGETYLGIYEFVMPFVQVGVTDRFSIGGGTPLIFGFEEDGFDRPYWVTPKLQVFRSKAVQASIGMFQGFGGGSSAGIAYGVVSTGGPAGSFTAGAGLAYNDYDGRAAVVMVGGERTVRRNMKFVTENYAWNSGGGIVSAGVRFFGDRLSADIALAMPVLDAYEGFVFPVVNFVYVFNNP